MKKVLVTGGCGVVGTILRDGLAGDYDLTCVDRRSCSSQSIVADVTDVEKMTSLFRGQDAVVHLAGNVNLDADWESVYRDNIGGTYSIFEASSRAGVSKVVFASSNHVTGLYERDWPISSIVKGEFEGFGPEQIPMVSHLSPPRPDSLYGSSKLFGEGIGRYYSEEYGISVVCLRLGTVRLQERPDPKEKRHFATWITHRDLTQLVRRSIENGRVPFDIFYGVSKNTWRFWDISHASSIIGYEPQDNAERYRS